MTTPDNADDGITRTTVEVDTAVWRKLRSTGVEEGKQVSEILEEVLRDYFDVREK